MGRSRGARLATGVAVVVLVATVAGCRETWRSELVTGNEAGTDSGNDQSPWGTISEDGTKVAFATLADDLGPTDTNGTADVYVRDLATGGNTLVSVDATGTDSGNDWSGSPVLSHDGTKVAFVSYADDLGPSDTNLVDDVYVRDLVAGTTTLVSVDAPGWGAGAVGGVDALFGPDDTQVLFRGPASQLFRRDLLAGITTLVSAPAPGTPPDAGSSYEATWSPDGTRVAFTSSAALVALDTNDRTDVYVRDLLAGTTTLASVNATGTNGGNDQSSDPVFHPGGTAVAFMSQGTDFGPPDPAAGTEILLRDLVAGTTTLVTAQPSGIGANGQSSLAAFSPDGTRIAFQASAASFGPVDTNGTFDTYVRDLTTGVTTLVSANEAGTGSGNRASGGAMWNEAGTKVVFASFASDLGPTDGNTQKDVYVRDLGLGVTSLVSATPGGEAIGGTEPLAYVGGRVLYSTRSGALGPNDTNGEPDLYLATVDPS